jgi:hypothetical protein
MMFYDKIGCTMRRDVFSVLLSSALLHSSLLSFALLCPAFLSCSPVQLVCSYCEILSLSLSLSISLSLSHTHTHIHRCSDVLGALSRRGVH